MLTTEPQSHSRKSLMKKAAFSLFLLFCVLIKAVSQPDSSQVAQSFLPLLVMNFDAKIINKNVQLQWTVTNNEDVKNFEIERAEDDNGFQKIGGKLSTGKEGKTNYEFVDALPKKNAGLSYRIKTVAKDGSSVYSNVQNTRVEEAVLQYKLKQNPVHQSIEVEIISPSDVSLQASIYTAYGQKAFVQTTKLFSGVNLLSLSSQNLLPGLHRLVLETGNERKVISFVKE